jgi:hypothetical protein
MQSRPKKDGGVGPEQKICAKRIDVKRAVIVESRTLGAPMVFSMPTQNLSRTGLLLVGLDGYKIPYQVNTLLEMSIDTTGSFLDQPVPCLGKIVRIQEEKEKKAFFGVQIVHMEPKDQSLWDKAVANLERDDGLRLLA